MQWYPKPYQKTGLKFSLTNPFSGLFLDPGLGKTSIILSLIDILVEAKCTRGVLVVAPLRVAGETWPNEINKWDNFKNLTYTVLHGKVGKQSIYGSNKNIYLINPEGLPWLYGELVSIIQSGGEPPFDTLIIDESNKFKSPTAKSRFCLIRDMLPLFKRRHILNGTPAPKGLLDVWAQICILDNGKALGANYYRFRNKFFHKDDYNEFSWYLNEGADEEIHELVAPLVLEMSASDHLDMPELLTNDIYVKLPTKAMAAYKELERDFLTHISSNEVSADTAAAKSMKCHQLANGAVYEDKPEDLTDQELKEWRKTRKTLVSHSVKIDALKDLVGELAGKPLLIAYNFKHDLMALKKAFGQDLPYIGSGVSLSKTKELITKWNNGELPILAGHPASMGHGLNMQESCNDICWYSITWNLDFYLQFIARVYRQGVKGHQVRNHRIIAKNTIDELMVSVLVERGDTQDNLREAIKKYRLKALNN